MVLGVYFGEKGVRGGVVQPGTPTAVFSPVKDPNGCTFVAYEVEVPVKRLIGRTWDEVKDTQIVKNSIFPIIEINGSPAIVVDTGGGTQRVYTARELLSSALIKLRNNALFTLGVDSKDVVMTVPTNFNDSQRIIVKDTAILAGFNVLRLVNEPTTATIFYTRLSLVDLSVTPNFMVVHCGSSQFDFTYISWDGGVTEILDSHTFKVGGDDIDSALLKYYLHEFSTKYQNFNRDNILETNLVMQNLKREICRAKIELSTSTSATIKEEINGENFEIQISREKFDELILPITDAIYSHYKNTCKPLQVDKLMVYGGTSLIPKVLETLEHAVGIKALPSPQDPQFVTCYGASVVFGDSWHNNRTSYTQHVAVPDRVIGGCGLYTNTATPVMVPLLSSTVDVHIVRSIASVLVQQTYKNEGESSLEAVYLWPIDAAAALCQFTVKIGDKEYVGRVLEKEKAFKAYDEAISASHGAFVVEKVQGDLLQINVGNLAPHTTAEINLTYICTLSVQASNMFSFTLPTITSHVYTPAGKTVDYDASLPNSTVVPTTVKVHCCMGSPISRLDSPTHRLVVYSKANSVRLDTQLLDKHFVLNIHTELDHKSSVVTSHDKDFGAPVGLFIIPTQHDVTIDETMKKEIIFVVDRSGSMGGTSIEQAKRAMFLFLKSLPEDCYFNIVGFGSEFKLLFPQSKPYNEESASIAWAHINSIDADFGGTEILAPLKAIVATPPVSENSCKQMILITDGQVSDTDDIISFISQHKSTFQVFSLGIGGGCSRHLVAGVAKAGSGACDFVADGDAVESKVIGLLKQLLQPKIVSVTVQYVSATGSVATTNASSLYNDGTQLFFYAPLQDFDFSTNSHLSATVHFFSTTKTQQHTVEYNTELDIKNYAQLLGAQAKIRELEIEVGEGARSVKTKEIVEICEKFQLVSKYASFLVVEKRSCAAEGVVGIAADVHKPNHHLYTSQVVWRENHSCDLLLLDVTPLSVGFESDDGSMMTVIPRNSTIPTKKIVNFKYKLPYPNALSIYEGERQDVTNNNKLGEVLFPSPDNTNSGVDSDSSLSSFAVTFDIDANGILNVTLQDVASGNSTKLTITNEKGRLSSDDIEKMVKNAEIERQNNPPPPPSDGVAYTDWSVASLPDTQQQDLMLRVVALQKVTGLWDLDEKFAAVFGDLNMFLDHNKFKEVVDLLPLSVQDRQSLLASSVALAYLSTDAAARRDQWELLAEKTTKKMEKILTNTNLKVEDLVEIGKIVFGDISVSWQKNLLPTTGGQKQLHISRKTTISVEEVD